MTWRVGGHVLLAGEGPADRGQATQNDVEVHVERLLHDLGRNQDGPAGTLLLGGAELGQNLLSKPSAIHLAEPSVQTDQLDVMLFRPRDKGGRQLLSVGHGVAHHEGAALALDRSQTLLRLLYPTW